MTLPNPQSQPETARSSGWLYQGKFWPAFWTVTAVLSLTINVILVVMLLGLGRQVFSLKNVLQNQLIGQLYGNFALMDEAHIKTTIPVEASVPAKFDLPLKTETTVTLTQDTRLTNATVARLETGGLSIYNAPADIVLPAGTQLPIALDLTVPVDKKIPVKLSVNVDIPLKDTDLHAPFVGLQNVVTPYYLLLAGLPGSWQEAVCGTSPSALCAALFK
jgi:hypothetical protein